MVQATVTETAAELVTVELYCDMDCPCFAPMVGGHEFPKYIEVHERDPRTKKQLPPRRERKRVQMRREQHEKLVKAINTPPRFHEVTGTPILGVWAWNPTTNQAEHVAKFLHAEIVEDNTPARLPDEQIAYYQQRDKIAVQMSKLAQRLSEVIDDPEKLAERAQIMKRMDELRAELGGVEMPESGTAEGKGKKNGKRGG